MFDEHVYIGSFMFCRNHGCEFCNACCTDHRLCNNIQIADKLSAAFPDLTEEELTHRPPISNILDKAVESKISRPKESERVYECKDHHKIDCSKCFDWSKVAVDSLKRHIKLKNSSKPASVAITLTREENLKFLHSMGAGLPPMTRIPDDAIEKKFRSAIDISQSFTKLVENPPFDPSSLSLWSTKKPKTLLESFKLISMAEALNHSNQSTNVFLDLRKTVMALAEGVDKGRKTFIVQDEDSSYAICIRVAEVRLLANDVPVMILLYGRGSRDAPPQETLAWIQEVMNQSRGTSLPQITSSPEEQKFFLTYLNMNARRLSSAYSPKRPLTERGFSLSFLLPISPLGQLDVGKLTHHTGCVVCGKKTTSKCSRCLSAEYCGTECQRLHWKEHKPMCNSLKDGEWVDITTAAVPKEFRARGNNLNFVSVNNMMSDLKDSRVVDMANPHSPPNIHGEDPFLIKMQAGPSIMIYDRTRSFQMYLCPDVDRKGYEQTMAQMHTGFRGLKIYRWAKRTGDMQLRVCLNKAPLNDPQW